MRIAGGKEKKMLDKYLVAGGDGWTNKRTRWSEKQGSD